MLDIKKITNSKESEYDLHFARRIRAAIRESQYRDWAQQEIGNAMKVKQNTVSSWMTGLRKPEIETGIELCKLLNISLDWLYTGRGPMRPLKESGQSDFQEMISRIQKARPSHVEVLKTLLDSLERLPD